MNYQVLARKWRPKLFEEVIGQEHVTKTLQNAIAQKKLAHAYLFTGTRGVGKTSIARLFSKAIRCESPTATFNPCLQCESCLEIDTGQSLNFVEIDGASHNGVDDVRSLIENVQYLPTKGQYKIYVIDEVHMLSTSAFNALLKTLEEPPAHAIFMLATTDPQKLLGTVISRCQRYDFKNVSLDRLKSHLKMILDKESIKIESDRVVEKIAELGKGSVRDSLSLLDQVIGFAGGKLITVDQMNKALGLLSIDFLKNFIHSLLVGDVTELTKLYLGAQSENVDLKKLSEQVLECLFKVIQSFDRPQTLSQEGLIYDESLVSVSRPEIFWIYESFAKDLVWLNQTQKFELSLLISLQKLALRRELIQGKPADPLPVVEIKEKKSPKSWQDFLAHLKSESVGLAANIERGNLKQEVDLNSSSVIVHLVYPEDASVFRDFLLEKENTQRLRQLLSDFFNRKLEDFILKVDLISLTEKKEKNFKTKVELDEEEIELKQAQKREQILNNPFVKEAEKIFGSKIDKVILKD